MGSLENPKTWVPSMNNQDCSKRICNLYCPQWCNYIVLPSPPPPAAFSDDDSGGGATLSPLVIVIIGVLGSAFLLISYYVIISRLCVGSNDSPISSTRRGIVNRETLDLEMDEDDYDMEDDRLNYAPWHVSSKGLDEDLINSIRVCKYKRGDGLVSCTDCSVCLGEFQEDESLRILPKCSHAFHVYCIDTWLTSHSNCPLCRANVSCVKAMPLILSPPPPPPLPPLLPDMFENDGSSSINSMPLFLPPPPPFFLPDTFENDDSSSINSMQLFLPPPPPPPPLPDILENDDSSSINSMPLFLPPPPPSLPNTFENHGSLSDSRNDGENVSRRVTSDLGRRDAIINIREEGGRREIRRSLSTSYLCQPRVSIADILLLKEEEEMKSEENRFRDETRPSEQVLDGYNRNLNCVVVNPITMKRSFSSGRYLFTRGWRGNNNEAFPKSF